MSGINGEVLARAVDRRSDEIVEWTKRVIRFASENRPPEGAEAPAQRFIADECRAMGWATDEFSPEQPAGIREHPAWLAGRNYGAGRNNVVARWKGTGGGKSILLSGHVDVAPFEPDDWKVCRPFEPVVRDGRLYGRGAADMKGGLAAAFWALRILRELEFRPAGNVLLESLVDEEFAGGNGTLAARLMGYNADLAIVPEPTQMQICPACFGAFLGDLVLMGKAGMPYTGTAIPNPIHGAARAVELFAEFQAMWRAKNHHPLFTDPGKELNVLVWKIDSNEPDGFTQMGTPLRTAISWIVWCHPGMTEERFYPEFEAFCQIRARTDPALAPFEMRLEKAYHFVKPWQTPSDHPGIAAAAEAVKQCGHAPVIAGAPFSCDLGVYGQVGKMPCLLLGPRGDHLHGPDEWVLVRDILDLTRIYATMIGDWCKG